MAHPNAVRSEFKPANNYFLIRRSDLDEIADPETSRERLRQIADHVRQETLPANAGFLFAEDERGKRVWVKQLLVEPPGIFTILDVARECWYAALGKAREFAACETRTPKFKLNKVGGLDVMLTLKLPPMNGVIP